MTVPGGAVCKTGLRDPVSWVDSMTGRETVEILSPAFGKSEIPAC